MKGIVIIATANNIYGQMAYNLAITIKATGSDIPIALVHDAAAINAVDVGIFDMLIPVEKDWNHIRFNIDKISPFEETMLLDADVSWIQKADPYALFSMLENSDIVSVNEGFFDVQTGIEDTTRKYLWWCDSIADTAKAYGITGKIYQCRWELVLFRKTKVVRSLFKRAATIRKRPLVDVKLFENKVCDEFCFNIALAEAGVEMPPKFIPAIASNTAVFMPMDEINKSYFAVSFGGIYATRLQKQLHDLIIKSALNKVGLTRFYSLQSKRDHLTTR